MMVRQEQAVDRAERVPDLIETLHRPASGNRNFRIPTSTGVLGPKRSASGGGAPVPNSVTRKQSGDWPGMSGSWFEAYFRVESRDGTPRVRPSAMCRQHYLSGQSNGPPHIT
jgi:hypothetical protein